MKLIKEVIDEWNESLILSLKLLHFHLKKARRCKKRTERLRFLQYWKKDRYPFTYAKEVDDYMDIDADEEKKKQLQNTVIYAHDSTRLISAAATIFRVMNVDSDRK